MPGRINLRPARLGRYELLRPIGVGGMAELHLARAAGAAGVEKLLAIKRILPEHARDPAFVDMFLNEARIAATLQHPNVVHVYDFGVEGGDYFLAMEFLDGGDVRGVLHALEHEGRAMPLEVAVAIAAGVAAGLHYVHEKRDAGGRPLALVHRDVSPQNIFVTLEGEVKLVDFGIAKATLLDGRTRAGTRKGKPAYMSPEQCRAEPLDRRSDIFALAIVLWELTVDRPLFEHTSDAEVMRAVVDRDAPLPSRRVPGYPPALERIVLKGLARDRERRYATAQEMQADLEEFAASSGLSISPRVVSAFMRGLVDGDAIGSWHRETQIGSGAGDLISTVLDAPGPAGESAAAAQARRTRPAAPRARRHVSWAVWLACAVLAAGGVGAAVLARRPRPMPALAAPPAPAPSLDTSRASPSVVAPAAPPPATAPAAHRPPPRRPRRTAAASPSPLPEAWDPNSALPPP
jgi:serine/threonine protein kinase